MLIFNRVKLNYEREKMKKSLIIVSVLFVFCTCTIAEPKLDGTPDELKSYLDGVGNFVRLRGISDMEVKADRAIVKIIVTTIESSLQRAIEKNREIESVVVKALVKGFILPEDIMTTSFSSIPQSGFLSSKVKKYKINNTIKIKIKNEKDFIQIASLIDKYSQIEFVGMEFENSEKEALKIGAIAKACDQINAKKKMFEDKFGVKLHIRTFEDETSEDFAVLRSSGYQTEKGLTSYASKLSETLFKADGSGFEQIAIQGRVTAVFVCGK